MKRVALINDLSGLGGCSLTAALPVLSVMGVRACPMPTAVLSNQTAYDSFQMVDMTDHFMAFTEEWKKRAGYFDAIATGFLGSPRQADMVHQFIDHFGQPGTLVLVDPVMGDDGKTYPTATPAYREKIRALVARADMITPNLTEACLLTDTPYTGLSSSHKLEEAEAMAKKMLAMGPQIVVVTGIRIGERVYNLACRENEKVVSSTPMLGNGYSGAGDLMTAVLLGGILQGRGLKATLDLASSFIAESVALAYRSGTDPNDGVNFECKLPMLLAGQDGRSAC